LKELLLTKGVKQKWLSSKVGVSEVTLSNWVTGKSIPSLKNVEKLSQILSVPIKDLVN
jgi:repressor LexA